MPDKKPIGRTGFTVEEVMGMGVNNPGAVVRVPEGLFVELMRMLGDLAFHGGVLGCHDFKQRIRELAAAHHAPPEDGEYLVRLAEKGFPPEFQGRD